MSTALTSPNVAVPGPLTWLHTVVTAPDDTGLTVILTSRKAVSAPSFAVSRSRYTPASVKLAVVSTALTSPNVAIPGPLTWLHTVVTAPGDTGSPSSVTVPSRVALFGKVIAWSGPASTVGGSFAGGDNTQDALPESVNVWPAMGTNSQS